MIKIILRLGATILGIALLLDAVLPQKQETATVDSHKSFTSSTQDGQWKRTETEYRLRFHGARISSCKVGLSTFSELVDGDVVTVRYSRILKNCTAINKGNIADETSGSWRFFFGLAGVFLLLGAAGLFRSFQFMGREIN